MRYEDAACLIAGGFLIFVARPVAEAFYWREVRKKAAERRVARDMTRSGLTPPACMDEFLGSGVGRRAPNSRPLMIRIRRALGNLIR